MTADEQATTAVHDFLTGGDDSLLGRVGRSAVLQREVERQQRDAVLAAQEQHSWAEIGAALGTSKQAAHRKFVTALAEDLRATHEEMKAAKRAGRVADSAAALGDVLVKADALRKVRRVR